MAMVVISVLRRSYSSPPTSTANVLARQTAIAQGDRVIDNGIGLPKEKRPSHSKGRLSVLSVALEGRAPSRSKRRKSLKGTSKDRGKIMLRECLRGARDQRNNWI
jgi:hypothetical protein